MGRDERPARRPRGRRLAGILVLLGLAGLVLSGARIAAQLMPRTFTATERSKIETWEIASRWRVMPKWRIFPSRVSYQVNFANIGSSGVLNLAARRLDIAQQATCPRSDGAGSGVTARLARGGCQAVLRATYADPTNSLVLTVGVAVLRDHGSSAATARYLTGVAPGPSGAVAIRPLLRPVPVAGSVAATFGDRQRQLSWVRSAGPYLVVATVGYADARPAEQVNGDAYAYLEMTSFASGVADGIAKPLGAQPPVPHCPGGPAC